MDDACSLDEDSHFALITGLRNFVRRWTTLQGAKAVRYTSQAFDQHRQDRTDAKDQEHRSRRELNDGGEASDVRERLHDLRNLSIVNCLKNPCVTD